MSKPFKFKQFSVSQDRCAMKIGTDGVLLGAWASLSHFPRTILDIGAGTGVISLQLAQRDPDAQIDAIEIDEHAFEQCTDNFENSPWGDRLYCYHASLQEFAQELIEEEEQHSYDLIISNPPFYTDHYKTQDEQRDLARFTDALPFEHLIVCAAHLLSESGRFCVILPKKEEEKFVALALEQQLSVLRKCDMRGTSTSPVKRVLLEFSFLQTETISEELVIEIARHTYRDAYKKLVQDFYLKM
jgi:tRNA1Val (adenine37-N6)-methyltransferase